MISPYHLKSHGISGSDYKLKFPGETIISYSDNRWSKGNVYEQLGFSRKKNQNLGTSTST